MSIIRKTPLASLLPRSGVDPEIVPGSARAASRGGHEGTARATIGRKEALEGLSGRRHEP